MSVELEKLARLINERWPEAKAKHTPDTTGEFEELWLEGPEGPDICYWPRETDVQSGSFIIWCLDRMGELGLSPCLRPANENPSGYVVIIGKDDGLTYITDQEEGLPFPIKRVGHHGETRAKACAKALIAALTSLPNTSLSEEEK